MQKEIQANNEEQLMEVNVFGNPTVVEYRLAFQLCNVKEHLHMMIKDDVGLLEIDVKLSLNQIDEMIELLPMLKSKLLSDETYEEIVQSFINGD